MEVTEPEESIFIAGVDPDHPTDEQARASPQATEWAKLKSKSEPS